MILRILWIILGLHFLYINLLAQCHIDDWTALKALYESTNGDNWEEKDGWDLILAETPPQNCDLSEMKGVTLDEDYNTRVEELFLVSNNLVGDLPYEIGNLAKIKSLAMPFNQISGSIPASIGELEKLRSLNFDFNLLTGNIPPEIGKLKNLIWLDMMNNQFSGAIPPEMGNLESIWQIRLNGNQLSGEIPEALGNLGIGLQLFLSNNQLTGTIPPVFADFLFNNLTLTLFKNNLSGCFDASLTQLCDSFKDGIYGFGDSISDGNDFDATWEEFCFEGKGVCKTINTLPLVGSFKCE